MAATQEDFLADAEQFSPSLFLNLPHTSSPTSRQSSGENLDLDFISRMLMEEDIHDRFFYHYPDHPAILAAQQPFAQIISDCNTSTFPSDDSAAGNSDSDSAVTATQNSDISNGGVEKRLKPLLMKTGTVNESPQEPMICPGDFFSGQTGNDMAMSTFAFHKGMEEANKFLPILLTNNSDKPMFGDGRGGKKKRHDDMEDLETGRSSKLMAWEQEEIGAREMMDEIMLHGLETGLKDLRIAMGSDTEKKSRRRRNDELQVDLRAMLIQCAQAVASGDRWGSEELLRQIKQHSSPGGNHATSTQRLAYYFAEGLEARLAGTGSEVYRSLVARRTSIVQYLEAYKLDMAATSFHKLKMVFVEETIMNAVEGKSRLHIVDYIVQYGFHWPGLFKALATREGGPPEVRITGIDLPQPGFRPAFKIEETGRRLTICAREFGLPFKFHGIAAKFESVCAEDLHIDSDEVLVVTCWSGLSSLLDESVAAMDKQQDDDVPISPKDMVLSNIQRMRPDVFIQGVVNGTYGTPFFVTRFREALFFYEALFDMLDATTPRDNNERRIIEQDNFGRAALNVIACEGADQPETYRQRQVRSHRAGLRQLPLDPEVVRVVMDKVKKHYHKDFVIDVERRWLLSGWKGRVLYAVSAWVAADKC